MNTCTDSTTLAVPSHLTEMDRIPRMGLARLDSNAGACAYEDSIGKQRTELTVIIHAEPREIVLAHLERMARAKLAEKKLSLFQMKDIFAMLAKSTMTPDQIVNAIGAETGDSESRFLGALHKAVSGIETTVEEAQNDITF